MKKINRAYNQLGRLLKSDVFTKNERQELTKIRKNMYNKKEGSKKMKKYVVTREALETDGGYITQDYHIKTSDFKKAIEVYKDEASDLKKWDRYTQAISLIDITDENETETLQWAHFDKAKSFIDTSIRYYLNDLIDEFDVNDLSKEWTTDDNGHYYTNDEAEAEWMLDLNCAYNIINKHNLDTSDCLDYIDIIDIAADYDLNSCQTIK